KDGASGVRGSDRLLALRHLQVLTNVGCAEATVATECADGGDLAGTRPPGDGLGIDAEELGNFRRGQQGLWLVVLVHKCPFPWGATLSATNGLVARPYGWAQCSSIARIAQIQWPRMTSHTVFSAGDGHFWREA